MELVKYLVLACVFIAKGFVVHNSVKEPIYVKYVDEIIGQFEKTVRKELGLVSIGNGGSMPHDIGKLSVKLVSNRYTTIEQARLMEVQATEMFLEMINSHEKARPFLQEFPFKENRAIVSISFREPEGIANEERPVVFVYQALGKVVYRTRDMNTNDLTPLHEEPYEEALKIVQASGALKEKNSYHPTQGKIK